jgi:hypothetical protein
MFSTGRSRKNIFLKNGARPLHGDICSKIIKRRGMRAEENRKRAKKASYKKKCKTPVSF